MPLAKIGGPIVVSRGFLTIRTRVIPDHVDNFLVGLHLDDKIVVASLTAQRPSSLKRRERQRVRAAAFPIFHIDLSIAAPITRPMDAIIGAMNSLYS